MAEITAAVKMLWLKDFSEKSSAQALNEMCPDKRRRLERMQSARAQQNTAAGDWLARQTVSELTGRGTKEICLCAAENGAPYIENSGLFVSISHSAELVVCAVSSRRVGIDVQRFALPSEKAVARLCSDEESLFVAVGAQGDSERFALLWTLKEAYCKAAGIPLMRAVSECRCFIENGVANAALDGWLFQRRETDGDYCAAVCEEQPLDG